MTRFLLLAWLCSPIALFAQTNHALIVAIGDYKRETGWGPIDSKNDVPLVEQVLKKQNFRDVVVLADTKADRNGIVRAFRELIARVQPGDNVVLHFSSHGQQISDQNGDEADGFDEAIVCYGAPNRAEGAYANYDGSMHLRDEDLGQLIDDLRRKLGADGDVLLLADACHSGTITRGGGLAKHRGGGPLRLKSAKQVQKSSKKPGYTVFMYPKKVASKSGMAPYVAMSAANADELNYQCYATDGQEVGSLSYAFNQAMQQPKQGESYRDLFSRMQSIMKQKVPAQTPQVEGDLDRQLFGGAVVAQQPYETVKRIAANRHQLTLADGQLAGLFDSTRVAVCLSGTRDVTTGPVQATGIVIRSTPYSATVQLDKPLPTGKEAIDYWVFITERASGDLSVSISLDSLTMPGLRQRVETELAKNRLVRFTGPPSLYITADARSGNQLMLRRATDGKPLDTTPVSPNQLSGLSAQVQRFAQSQFLQQITFTGNPSVQLSARLIPLKARAKTVADTVSDTPYRRGSLLGFTEDDKVALMVTNTGSVTLYYTVLDIMPNGDVAVIFPRQNDASDQPANYSVPPGQRKLAWQFITFEPPYGKETFKVFATTEPVDLRTVVGRSRGTSATRGSMKFLEKLYDDTNDMLSKGVGTRGGGVTKFPDDANIVTVNYEFLILDKSKP